MQEIIYGCFEDLPELKESQMIEFKGWTYPFRKDQLSDIQNLICSWVNTTGGTAIIGISESHGNEIIGMYLDPLMKKKCIEQIRKLGVTPHLPENVRASLIPIPSEANKPEKYLVRIDVEAGDPEKYYGRNDSQFNFVRSAMRCPETKKFKNIKIQFDDIKRKKAYKNISVPAKNAEDRKPEKPEKSEESKAEKSKGHKPQEYHVLFAVSSHAHSRGQAYAFSNEEEAEKFRESQKELHIMTAEQYLVHSEKEDCEESLARMKKVDYELSGRLAEMMEKLETYNPYSRGSLYNCLQNLRSLLDSMRAQLNNEKVAFYTNDEPH